MPYSPARGVANLLGGPAANSYANTGLSTQFGRSGAGTDYSVGSQTADQVSRGRTETGNEGSQQSDYTKFLLEEYKTATPERQAEILNLLGRSGANDGKGGAAGKGGVKPPSKTPPKDAWYYPKYTQLWDDQLPSGLLGGYLG